MKKNKINSPAKVIIAIAVVFLLLLIVFLGTSKRALENNPTEIAHAEAVKATSGRITFSFEEPQLIHSNGSEYQLGEPVYVDLATESDWIGNIVDNFRTSISYSSTEYTVNRPAYYNAASGSPTSYFKRNNYTDSEDKTRSWSVRDVLEIRSDNGATPISGNHPINNGSSYVSAVARGEVMSFYCETCHANKSASEIQYHVCSACHAQLTAVGTANNNKYAVKCSNTSCPNNNKIFMTGNVCPGCGGTTTISNGIKTCTRSTCALRNKEFIDYYDNTVVLCNNGHTITPSHPGTETEPWEKFKVETPKDIGDAEHFKLSVASLKISGYDWTGKKITNKEIYDGTDLTDDVLAGIYYVSYVKFNLTADVEYYSGYSYCDLDCYQSYYDLEGNDGSSIKNFWIECSPTTTHASFNANSFGNKLEYTYAQGKMPIVCTSSIVLDSTKISQRVNNNLVNVDDYVAVYNPSINWSDKIGLYKSTSFDIPGEFHYSLGLVDRAPFTLKKGITNSEIPNSTLNVPLGDGTVADFLKIEWYHDAKLNNPVDDNSVVESGDYYIVILPTGGSDSNFNLNLINNYTGESGFDFKKNLIRFIYSDGTNMQEITDVTQNGVTSVYVQHFCVSKTKLKVDVVNNYGGQLIATSKMFERYYDKIPLTGLNAGSDLPSDIMYYQQIPEGSGNYVLQGNIDDNGTFTPGHYSPGVVYYTQDGTEDNPVYVKVPLSGLTVNNELPTDMVFYKKGLDDNYIPIRQYINDEIYTLNYTAMKNAAELFQRTVKEDLSKSAWTEKMGGFAHDYPYYDLNTFSFSGTMFPDPNPGVYDSLILSVSFNDSSFNNNYCIELGEFDNYGNWNPYSYVETENQSYFLGSFVDPESGMIHYQYRFFHPEGNKFTVYSPPVEITVDEQFGHTFSYGEIFDYTEIDTSIFGLEGEVAYDAVNDYYTFGSADWVIKIVNNKNDAVSMENKNVIYIVASFYILSDELSYGYQDGYVSKAEEGLYESRYYRIYTNRLYPFSYNEDSQSYSDGGRYFLSYYVMAKPISGDATYIPTGDGLTAVWDVAADNPNPIDHTKTADERLVDALVAFRMEDPFNANPYEININKLDVYYNVVDYAPEKYYDGTNAVYAPNYIAAVGGKDYFAGATISRDPGDTIFYEYDEGTDRYYETLDTVFGNSKTYYIVSRFKPAVKGSDYTAGATVSSNSKVFYEYFSVDGQYYQTRDEVFSGSKEYYLKLPNRSCELELFVLDPTTTFTPREARNEQGETHLCHSVLEYDLFTYFESIAWISYQNERIGDQSIILNGEIDSMTGELMYFTSHFTGSQTEPNNAIRSYKVKESLFYRNVEQSDFCGVIKPLSLRVTVLPDLERLASDQEGYSPAYYSRPYHSFSGVAIMVADHNATDASGQHNMTNVYKENALYPVSDSELALRPELADYYYAYYLDADDFRHVIGFVFYGDMLRIASERKIKFIRLKIEDGFLENEGFYWQGEAGFGDWQFPVGYKDFLYNPIIGESDALTRDKEKDFIYWYNAGKADAAAGINGATAVPIGYDTAYNGSDVSDFYILHLDYEYSVTNYVITYFNAGAETTDYKADSWFTFAVTKAILTPEDIDLIILPDENPSVGKYLQYNSCSHYTDIVMAEPNLTYVTFYGHPELSDFYNYDATTGTFSGAFCDTLELTYQGVLAKTQYQLRGWIIDTYVSGGVSYDNLRGTSLLTRIDRNNNLPDFDFDSIVLKKGNYNRDGRFLTVISFTYKTPDGNVTVTGDDITDKMKSFTLAGTYVVGITIPESSNYSAVKGATMEFTVSSATVRVYTTVASRKYMEEYDETKEIGFVDSSPSRMIFVDSEEELETYEAYIDADNGEIYLDKASIPSGRAYYKVYVYHNPFVLATGTFSAGTLYYQLRNGVYENATVTVGNTIPANSYYVKSSNKSDWTYDIDTTYVIYCGIQHRDGIASNPLETFGVQDAYASVRNNIESFLQKDGQDRLIDEARIYGRENIVGLPEVAIEIYGAYKQNYEFYFPGQGETSSYLYVWPQILSLEVDYHQQIGYSGDAMIPDYNVYNEDHDEMTGATMGLYIAGYYYADAAGKIHVFVNEFTQDGSAIASTRPAVFATAAGEEETADAYYYFLQGDERIYVYCEGTSCFYYADNNSAGSKVYLSDPVTIDDTYQATCLNVIDGKEIYIWINEDSAAAGCSEVNSVIDVYMADMTKGGYILKVSAKPDNAQGCSETNYRESQKAIILFDILSTIVKLDDEKIYIEKKFDGSVYGSRNDDSLYFNSFFINENAGAHVETKMGWGWVSIEKYYYNPRTSAATIAGMNGITYESAFSAADRTDWGRLIDYEDGDLVSAGWYILLMKASISDGTSTDGRFDRNMIGNIGFKAVPAFTFGETEYASDDTTIYFIVYLARSRADDYQFDLTVEGLREENDINISGIDKVYSKSYDKTQNDYDFILRVTNRDSSKGQIVSVTASVSRYADMTAAEDFFTTRRNVKNAPYVFGEENGYAIGDSTSGSDGTAYFYNKISGSLYNLTSDIDFKIGKTYYELNSAFIEYLNLSSEMQSYMLNSYEDPNGASFYLRFKVNDRNSGYYDNNYAEKTFVFAVCIRKAELQVRIITKEIPPEENNGISGERYESSKYYGEAPQSVEYKFGFEFIGWNAGDENLMSFYSEDMYPVINWNGITASSPAGSDYHIYAASGPNTVELDNYVMVYEQATQFVILRRAPTVSFEATQVYQGKALTPTVIRVGIDGQNLDDSSSGNPDILDANDITIRRKGMYNAGRGRFWYTTVNDPLTKIYDTIPAGGLPISAIYSSNFDDAFVSVGSTYDVGLYLYEVSFGRSSNYLAIEPTYYLFEVTKAPLTLKFWDINSNNAFRGYAEKIYDKSTTNYPLFVVAYEGFVGGDDSAANKAPQTIMYYRTSNGETTGIRSIGLINPYYVFVDGETGKESVGNYADDYIYPIDIIKDSGGNVIPYYVKLILSDTYGIADNYYISVDYFKNDANKVLYPEMVITPRPVIVTFDSTKDRIAKIYDGTTAVIAKSVTNANYLFAPKPGDEKSGLIAGDEILLDVDYNASRYSRKDVYEQTVDPVTGETVFVKSDVIVTVYASDQLLGAQKNNYKLFWEDENDKRIQLLGTISQAKATVQFFADETMRSQVRSRVSVVYNGERQPVYKNVFGVPIYNDRNEIVGYETIDYSQRYYSEETMYDSDTLPPINCAEYIYELTVKNDTLANRNYLAETSWIRLEIGLADVTIVFGGDAMQTYGDIGLGLTAVANGIGGYSERQEVAYFSSYTPKAVYNDNGDILYYVDDQDGFSGLIPDITRAFAGTYFARVIYQRTTNFRDSFAYEEFTILPRETVCSFGSLAEEYPYSGETPEIEFYIMYEEERIAVPQVLYNVARNGVMEPYNYTISDGVITNIRSDRTPINVGEYQVKPYDQALSNFIINNATWIDFKITKVDVLITVENASILVGEDYTPQYSVLSSSTKENVVSVLRGRIQLRYYDAVTGEELDSKPTKAGTYKVMPEEIALENYNVHSQWGTLVINNNEINASMPGQTSSADNYVMIVGSFGQDTKITVSEAQNVPESDISRLFDSYKENNKEMEGYYLSSVFVFSIENYTYTGTEDTGFTIKIKVPGLSSIIHRSSETAQNVAYAAEEDVYVAVFYEDGSMQIVSATIEDDDSLSFETSSSHVKAISILTMEDPYAVQEVNLDWLMYLFIGIGVLALGLALLLVLKRNG